MLKNRMSTPVNCSQCPVASLCIAHDLNPEEKEKINGIITRLNVINSGEHLYLQNQKMQYIFAVYSGCCKEYFITEDGDEKIKGFYYPGDLLGLESLSSKKYAFSAIALDASQFCAIPIDLFFQLVHESFPLLYRFVSILSEKLQRNRNSTMTTNAKRRIAAFLLDIFYRPTESKLKNDSIHLSMSQFDISNLLGLAHETVSRTLHMLQDEEIIKITKKNISIKNINSLKTIANIDAGNSSKTC